MPESTRQRRAFDVYWELGGERSIERLKAELDARPGRSPGLRTLYEWSRRYHWQVHIGELERRARQAADQERLAALREMYDRQAREALFLQQKGAEWLTAMSEDQATAEAAVRAIVEGTKLERLARGEPSERNELKEGDNDEQLERFSTEQLQQLAQFAESLVESAAQAQPQ